MRKVIVVITLCLAMLVGCNTEFDPVVTQVTTTIKRDEVFDPLALIVDVENVGLSFLVKENTVNSSIPGSYYIDYIISSKDGKKSIEKRFEFFVADNDAPVLIVDDAITIKQGSKFTIKDYASAVDERDGDVSEKITYSGVVNTYKVGDYDINVSVTDRFGNSSSKDVKVTVTAVSNDELAKNIIGDYTDTTYTDGQAPTITLKGDGSFILYVNGCTVFSAIEGDYIVYEGYLYLTSESQPFSSIAEQNIVSFQIQPDGNLTFISEMETCAPNYGDTFTKNSSENN